MAAPVLIQSALRRLPPALVRPSPAVWASSRARSRARSVITVSLLMRGSFASGRSPVSRVARKRYVRWGGAWRDSSAAIQDQDGSAAGTTGQVPRGLARCVAVAVHGSSGHGWRG
ncbi:hypothetical protein G6F55_014317 [Rhizopus delemar]|nr:hypothetical protein G6F55_014317 [Rhizopus delemar]